MCVSDSICLQQWLAPSSGCGNASESSVSLQFLIVQIPRVLELLRLGQLSRLLPGKGEGAVGRLVWCYSNSLCFFVSCMAPTNGLLARIINEAAERWKNSVSSSFPLLNSPWVSCRSAECCKARDQSWPRDLRALPFLPKAEEIVRVTPGGLSIKSLLLVARVFPNF